MFISGACFRVQVHRMKEYKKYNKTVIYIRNPTLNHYKLLDMHVFEKAGRYIASLKYTHTSSIESTVLYENVSYEQMHTRSRELGS